MRSHLIRLHRSGRSFLACDDETILAAAARNSVWLPASCRSGQCGSCAAKLISGELSHAGQTNQFCGLTGNFVRLCIATARSDVVVEIEELDAPPAKLNKRFPAVVVSLEAGLDGPSNLRLRFPRAALAALSDGQFIKVTAPIGLLAFPLVVSSREGSLVTFKASGDVAAGDNAMTSMASEVGAVIQVEVLVFEQLPLVHLD